MKRFIALGASLLALTGCFDDNRDHSLCAPKSDVRRVANNANGLLPALSDGTRLIEGDIAIDDHQVLGSLQQGGFTTKSAIVTQPNRVWPNGIVYYSISADLPEKARVDRAIKIWEEATDGQIQFEERSDEENYVEIVDSDRCFSAIGMAGGRQRIGLNEKCSVATTVHEFGHTLGLWHEQSRTDRDEYVKVNWCNIEEGLEKNFYKKSELRAEDVGPYDYGSIMHYGSMDFSNRLFFRTLESRTNQNVRVFSASTVSKGDVAGVLALYESSDSN